MTTTHVRIPRTPHQVNRDAEAWAEVPDEELHEAALGKAASFADVCSGVLPVPGNPDAWSEWTRRHPPKPLPPPCVPRMTFDRKRLAIVGDGFEYDIVAERFSDAAHCPRRRLEDLNHEERGEFSDALYDATFEVFAARPLARALAVGDYSSPPFDPGALQRSGQSLDWDTGAIHPVGSASSEEPEPCPLMEVEPDESGTEELIVDHYLDRGGALLIAGQTGIGKSTLGMQFAVGWALGMPVLGFEPARNLSTLVVQAENSPNDLAEMRDGMLEGFELDEQQEAQVNLRVAVVTCDEFTGQAFGAKLQYHIREWRPDVVVIDPLLAFAGGDLSKQEVASDFLRGVLQPIARKARVGLVLLHHTGKPPRDDKGDAPLADYLGFGSSELANWPRAIVAVHRVKGQRGVFKMELGKRGHRLRWFGTDGSPMFNRTIAHSPGGIHWREIDATEEAKSAIASAPTKDKLLALVPLDGQPISKAALISKARDAGIGEKRAIGWLAELNDDGKLHTWRIPRKGTNPERVISRQPQPPQPDLPITS